MTFVSELEPTELWGHFDKILTIPRGSRNETAMAAYVTSLATQHSLSFDRDSTGNLVIRKPAVASRESAPITVLQSHLDMVNEKNADVDHDFTRDPIRPRRADGYLRATGTTLGSDNGIGVAAALAILESDSIAHGPLELLFTVDEETGLTGAANLGPDFLKGRRLINMDSEEEGALYIGCAGGAGINLSLPLQFEATPSGRQALKIELRGLRGGHSGVDIHLQRGNAVQLLARVLRGLMESQDFNPVRLEGGNMHNAIPREAFATLCLAPGSAAGLTQSAEALLAEIGDEFRPAEPDLKWTIKTTSPPDQVLTEASARTVLDLIAALPHGVTAMSYNIPELVETSANLATVGIEDNQLSIHVSNRSSVASALHALQQKVASIGRLAGAGVQIGEGYPGWKPNLNSQVLQSSTKVFRAHLDRDPEVKAIHAGLECGLIGEKYPGMDMVSFGPQIEFPHSPDERVKIQSVAEFYQLLQGVLEELAAY